ncbi:TPA: polynucleotide adenylyltransferase, partial [Patescibacteria group bacterium]|nr:polynucleotide adenylyltransferase [Patescibacteria group bacterium]
VGMEQKLYHKYDVYEHSLRTCDIAEDSVKLVALLHDIGKVRTDMGNGHFYGHDIIGAQMTQEILKRLRFSKQEIEKASRLVRNHMFY